MPSKERVQLKKELEIEKRRCGLLRRQYGELLQGRIEAANDFLRLARWAEGGPLDEEQQTILVGKHTRAIWVCEGWLEELVTSGGPLGGYSA